MKKHLLAVIIVCIGLPLFAEKVNAQYGPEYGAYLNYSLTKRYRHPATKRKMKAAKRNVKTGRKNIKRTRRHVSAAESLIAPKTAFSDVRAKRTEIV